MLCFLLCYAHSFLPPLYLSSLLAPASPPPCSSLSAGCRGGVFIFTMSRINLRIREQLFSSLLRQDLGFFQETKTGGAWIPCLGFPWTSCCSVTLPLHSASPCACIHRDRAWSCISLFWDRVVRKPPLVSASEGGSLEEGAMSEGKVRREFLGVLYYTWIPHRLCPPQGS